ncbi:acetyl/propionyl/methylcrotonyl-CoA carboxylase subunit alpha [Aestuariibacter sp. AA17]|uniref:Acetyl/propionyl/methylcrotonyl-CoA carboxylase subunit alpha n=1 Tax=Fluctibacter corallii TaxID=2984329 RepID=A0ABT3A9B7_9ALTE|nr:acetyl/propionyl/methylcrotonyl-CoA carboxylase subunit alpha [Aestuariibacter sp. AA17]MCV2885223.1 acetyl/propionyl/methylcrotonyl-CoA carboxylase subunit alpha [Aestuariibacter sp. AA17]
MFKKLLIANRGEITCRVIHSARKLGVKTVAIYSDADANALHVNMADEAVHVGPSPSRESYLQAKKIIDIAVATGADAIHPGYGFLSENADFARMCEDNDIEFVGPPASAIEAMGSKSAAKQIMEEAGVPLVPGYHGDDQAPDILKKHADDMGYPVLLKAAAGGGGKGMRQVWSESEFTSALNAAKREAMSSFGDDIMLVEKYLTQPRHVEIQVFCDKYGKGVYLFERDCSVQRRHQKVIEEAPAPGMSDDLRAQMGEAALKAANAIDYVGAGTVEFLLDSDGRFYFMEMNTRLQVEHPVTEMITGEDLVEWQLRVASGEPLPKRQEQLTLKGHAFEARVYAEDPNNDFLPATGTLHLLRPPVESDFVRVDTGVNQGDDVSVFYDPMIAKLIVWDENREKALARLSTALSEYHIEGVTTNIDFLYNLSTHASFKHAELTTNFIEKHEESLFKHDDADAEGLIPQAALYLLLSKEADMASGNHDRYSPWQENNNWRANEVHAQTLTLRVDDKVHTLSVTLQMQQGTRSFLIETENDAYKCQADLDGDMLITTINGHRRRSTVVAHEQSYSIFTSERVLRFSREMPDLGLADDDTSGAGLTAPMNGTVVAHLVEVGTEIGKGTPLMVMEAMKMEHQIAAPTKGTVKEFFFQPGELVDGGATLLDFEESDT